MVGFSRMTNSRGKHFRETDRGSGAGGVVAFVLGLSIAISGFLWVTDWIYNTKEAKVHNRWLAHLERIRGGANLIDRGPGEYQVSCRPGYSSECR
jgi:hypothetical protein